MPSTGWDVWLRSFLHCFHTGGWAYYRRLGKGSAVSREVHAAFCERPRVRFPRPTLLVILCRHDVSRPMDVLQTVLKRLDLHLNEAKTNVVDARTQSFDFLGFSFQLRCSRKSGKVYPHVEPSRRSQQRLKDRVKQLTDRRRCPVPLDDMMKELNNSLRGWSGYFHYRNSSKVFGNVKMQVEERLRTQLRRRHKLLSRGSAYGRFPSHSLYGRYGLYKLPTTAQWNKAHALR